MLKINLKVQIFILGLIVSSTRSHSENNPVELTCQITSNLPMEITTKNPTEILAINTCPRTFHDPKIINKCEQLFDSESSNDPFLFTPVTNKWSNVSYWNKYCAICNSDYTENNPWNPWIPQKDCEKQEIAFPSITNFVNSRFKCLLEIESKVRIRRNPENRCQMNEKLLDIESTLKAGNSTLKCNIWAQYLPAYLSKYLSPCHKEIFLTNTYKGRCIYFNLYNGLCTNFIFLAEDHQDLRYDENGDIFVQNWPLNRIFNHREYVKLVDLDGMIFFCLPSQWPYSNNLLDTFSFIMAFLSIIFLLAFFITNLTKNSLKSFPNKILYSYSIVLLLIYISYFCSLSRTQSCFVPHLMNMAITSYFLWTILFCFEYVRMIVHTLRKRKIPDTPQIKRYLIYCSFGFVLPLTLLLWPFFKLPLYENNCLSIPGFSVISCEPIYEINYPVVYYLFQETTPVFFACVLTVLFLLACVMIYWAKTDSFRSSLNRKYWIIYFKMAYMIGPQWSISMMLYFYEIQYVPVLVISRLFIFLQGVFVFFAFGFEKNIFYRFLDKCKLNIAMMRDEINLIQNDERVEYAAILTEIGNTITNRI